MTDKKALEVLKSWLQLAYQNADGTDECCAELYEALQTVFALINRQQAEIERLKGWQDLLKAEKHSLIKAEAVKEFAERLKSLVNQHHYMLANIHNSRDFGMFTVGFEQAIDNIVKEMVGENNA